MHYIANNWIVNFHFKKRKGGTLVKSKAAFPWGSKPG